MSNPIAPNISPVPPCFFIPFCMLHPILYMFHPALSHRMLNPVLYMLHPALSRRMLDHAAKGFVGARGDANAPSEQSSKLGLQQLAEYIGTQGHDWAKVWGSIQRLVVKALISVQPHLRNNYRR